MFRSFLLVWFSALAAFAQFFEGIQPSSLRPVATFRYTFFAVGYSNETRTPLWSVMEVKNAGEPTLGCMRVNKFAAENRADPPITHKDYANNEGYSRGHMTPNAIVAYVYGCEAATTTFITSNIVSQLQRHNAGVWEALESAIGGKATSSGFVKGLVQKAPAVWIYTGPVFWGKPTEIQKLGPKEIWIPTALWKTVIWKTSDGATKACSWLIPHRDDIPRNAFMTYAVSIKEIEEQTGVDILGDAHQQLSTEVDAQDFLNTIK